MASRDVNGHSTSSTILSVSSISELSPELKSSRRALIDPIPQTLYSTAVRYQRTNRQALLNTLQNTLKSRRYKLFYGVLCVITLVLSYQFILYLMSDLATNYNYKQPLFIHYISYSIFPFLIGLPLVHPLWIIANKYHKSNAKQRIIISPEDNTNNETNGTKQEDIDNKRAKSNRLCPFVFSSTESMKTKTAPQNTARSEVVSTSYLSDDYEEYDEDHSASLLNDDDEDELTTKQSTTELGMLSELSFNDIVRNKGNKISATSTLHRNGMMFPYNSYKTNLKTYTNHKLRSVNDDNFAKSECIIKNGEGFDRAKNEKKSSNIKHIIVTSARDISQIPQSVYFKLDLPFRSFRFYFRKIGLWVFCVLFLLHAIANVLWILSIQNAIDLHAEGFYIENSIHCGRVIASYVLCVFCLKLYYNYRNILCLLMLVFGLIAILFHNWNIFTQEYDIKQGIILGLAPIFNGILALYIEYISTEFFYKKSFAMFVGDILFILGLNSLMNLMIIWIVLLVAHCTTFEVWILPTEWHIIWRLITIAALWSIYNIALFVGITLLNCVVIGFGFALIIPCNVLFDTNIKHIFELQNGKQTSMMIGICLICLAFIIYEMHFYVLYIMYCGQCSKCCAKCRTSCIRSIHKKTRYRLYGQCQCCRIYRCC